MQAFLLCLLLAGLGTIAPLNYVDSLLLLHAALGYLTLIGWVWHQVLDWGQPKSTPAQGLVYMWDIGVSKKYFLSR